MRNFYKKSLKSPFISKLLNHSKIQILPGFTLAEVLVSLLIIGVVASLVIPGLINDTKSSEYNVKVKKIYTDLSQAVGMLQVNNGGIISVGNGIDDKNNMAFRDDFCNIMSCAKKGNGTTIFGTASYRFYKGNVWAGLPGSGNDSAALSSGYLLRFSSFHDCNNYGIGACGAIFADINGPTGPNMLGKDVYWFYATKNKETGKYSIFPAGGQGDTNTPPDKYCIKGENVTNNGLACTYVRLTTPEKIQ